MFIISEHNPFCLTYKKLNTSQDLIVVMPCIYNNKVSTWRYVITVSCYTNLTAYERKNMLQQTS